MSECLYGYYWVTKRQRGLGTRWISTAAREELPAAMQQMVQEND